MARLKYLIMLGLFFCFAANADPSHFSNMVVFGDSLSDVGNSTWVKVLGRGPKYLYGAPISSLDRNTLTPRNWVQYLVLQYPFKQSSIMPSRRWHGQNLSTSNVDYAWVNAETGARYLNDQKDSIPYTDRCMAPGLINPKFSCVPGVLLQVKQFLFDLDKKHQSPGKQTLFIIWAGGNDIFDTITRIIYRIGHSYEQPHLLLPSDQYALAWSPASNIYTAVTLLLKAGVPADHIMVFNLPNLAEVPAAISLIASTFPTSESKQYLALQLISGITQLFNFDLRLRLTYGLHGQEKPRLVYINKIFTQIVKTHYFQGYYFHDVSHSCVHKRATPFCQGYLFFNGKHPSASTGRLLAMYISRII